MRVEPLQLGDVIAALLEKRAHVPYRNSQLTRLLSDSLGGNSKVVLLAHLAPEAASLPETQSTLLFSQRWGGSVCTSVCTGVCTRVCTS
jgi:hypothetical protein